MSSRQITVAEYVDKQLKLCGKTQREVAQALGYMHPNIMSMIKTGATKVPIAKVETLALALNVDPAYFLRLVMNEYMPEAWSVIEGILDRSRLLSDRDMALALLVRDAVGKTNRTGPSTISCRRICIFDRSLPTARHSGSCGGCWVPTVTCLI